MRFAVRHPGFTVVCVVSLAMGIGLAAALASIADAILYRPLPVPDASRIVRTYTSSTEQTHGYVSFLDFEDFRRESQTIGSMVAQTQVLVAIGSAPAKVRLGLAVSTDYFDALRVRAELGRTFRAEESRSAVVVLADAFWRSEFGADRGLIGHTIRIGTADFTVLGIAPRDFGMDRFTHESFYVPMGVYESGILPANGRPLEDRSRRFLNVFGRLEPPGRIEEARAEFATIAARLESAYPQTNRGKRALVLGELEARLQTDYTLPSLAMLLIAMGALVLAIGAANAGGLMLARAEAKSRETAIRIALGATAARLLRGSMKQAAWFAGAGATLGVAIAWAAVKSLARVATLPTDFPFAIAPRIDARVLVVSSLALIFATLITGCAPSVKLRRWRDVLVAIEIALASALAATGIWLIANVRSASAIDPGYRVDHVLTLALDPSQIGYTAERTRLFFRQLLEGVRGITGVKNVALAQSAVLGYTRAPAVVEIEREREHRTIWSNAVTPEYFGLMRIAIVAGRGFDDRDATNSPPVAIVNQELARRCGIGLRIRVNGRAMVVIGIAHNAKYFDVQEAPQPYIYLPYAQVSPSRMVLHVETSGDPALLARAVVNQVHQLDPEQPVSEMRPLRDYLEQGSMFGARIGIDAIGAVGACAIALALAGVYGVTSQVVARRRRELGIRIAIGATRRNVITIVLRRGAILAGVGAVVGLAIAWAVTRALSAIAAGTGPGIGSQEIAAAVAIAMVSMVAALVPAYRAARIDPAIALRQE